MCDYEESTKKKKQSIKSYLILSPRFTNDDKFFLCLNTDIYYKIFVFKFMDFMNRS